MDERQTICTKCSATIEPGRYCCPSCEVQLLQRLVRSAPSAPQSDASSSCSPVLPDNATSEVALEPPAPAESLEEEELEGKTLPDLSALDVARSFYSDNEFGQAVTYYQEAARLFPQRADIQQELASALFGQAVFSPLPSVTQWAAWEAALAAGRAMELGDPSGDCEVIVAQCLIILNKEEKLFPISSSMPFENTINNWSEERF